MEIMKEVEKELLRTSDFEIVPARTSPRNIIIKEDNLVEDPMRLINRWELGYDGDKKMFLIQLYRDGTKIAYLHLDGGGVFRGREWGSNGTCLLRPLPKDANRWKMFGNPSKYLERIKPDEEEESFVYLEPLAASFEWEDYQFDIKKESFNAPQNDTAIALICCNRPQYFSQVINSLKLNPESCSHPIFCFMDKPTNRNEQGMVNDQKLMVMNAFPHAVCIKRPVNFGCGRNIIDARRQLFDNLGYKRVFVFEDDMVVSPTYMRYLLNMMDWADANYSDIGTVQGWNICGLTKEEKEQHKYEVVNTYTNRWGYLQKKEAWDSISREMYIYERLFLFPKLYSSRSHRSIQHWFNLKIGRGPANVGDKRFPINFSSKAHWESLVRSMPTGQDGVTMVLDYCHGWKRLAPVVNRGKYIGKVGIHMSPQRFAQHGLDKIEFDIIPGDNLITTFREV